MFFPNKPDEDWYWLVVLNIVYLSLFHIVSSVFAEFSLTLIVWKKYSASIPSTRMTKESTVVKKKIRWAGPSQRRREQRRVRGVVNYCPSIGSQNRSQVYRCRSPRIKGEPPSLWAIKAFKKGVLYHGEDCNRGPKNDPPILEPAFLLVNRWSYMTYLLGCLPLAWSIACQLSTVAL